MTSTRRLYATLAACLMASACATRSPLLRQQCYDPDAQLASLLEPLRLLETSEIPYRVEIAPALRRLAAEVDRVAGEVPALFRSP